MKSIILTIYVSLFLVSVSLFSQTNKARGITENIDTLKTYKVSGELKPTLIINNKSIINPKNRGVTANIVNKNIKSIGQIQAISKTNKNNHNNINRLDIPSNWLLTDSIYVNSLIPGNNHLGVMINSLKRKLELISPYNLSDKAKQAVAKSPRWMRPELETTLSKLSIEKQDIFADLILNAHDPIIDEIAFSIAYTPATFLNSRFCYPQLFVENAEDIYSHDKDLKYVDIVNYGDSENDENYYSTVKYWKIDSIRGKIQIEVPKFIYYMYIVHPKITDEMPTYINPNIVETNFQGYHVNNIAAPPTGVFWRDYLYNHTEAIPDTTGLMFPILKDSVSVCDVIWNDTSANNHQAIRAISKWVRDVMDFTSKQERPHQPVRIYDLHIGRCGEHQDLTAAAARACLIPCRGIAAYSIDHVWNEFWDEGWWQWEPVNNAYRNQLAYITWGTIGTVAARQSCGVVRPVTDAYNDYHNSVYNIFAYDSKNKPIDGAMIKIYKNIIIDNKEYIIFDTYGVTDDNGLCSFVLGKNNKYYLQLQSTLGNNPPESNKVIQFVNNSGEGQIITYHIKAPNSRKDFLFNNVDLPEDNNQDLVLKVHFNYQGGDINWKLIINDLGGCNTFSFIDTVEAVKLYVCDKDNYNKYITNQMFNAYQIVGSSSDFEFNVPAEKDWYVFLGNNDLLSNYQKVEASFSLYRDPTVGIDDENITRSADVSSNAYPNPFSNLITIKYKINTSTNVKVSVYNVLGYEVAVLVNQFKDKGVYQTQFKANNMPDGVYYYKIQSGDKTLFKQIILTK
jgi:hypothetical protein